MTKLSAEIDVHRDDTANRSNIKYVAVEKGLIAGAFEWRGQLFVRAQLNDPSAQTWEEAWAKVQERFGFGPENVRTEQRLHLFDDGTELRQAFLGDFEGTE